MSIFVIEIGGAAIAAIAADSKLAVKMLVNDEGVVRDDLLTFESNGRPLWDGISEVIIRTARLDEIAQWKASLAAAQAAGGVDEESAEEWVAFLVPVIDPAKYGDGT